MTWFTVQATYAGYYGNIVSVEAETLDEALRKAIEVANQDPNWKSGGSLRPDSRRCVLRRPGRGPVG